MKQLHRLYIRIAATLLIFAVCTVVLWADDNGDLWHIYASYHNPTKAVKAGSKTFVLANSDLYSYDTEDQSVETYDKTFSLSDFGIYDIGYSTATKTLVVLYSNANIDIMDTNGESWNMPELKQKPLNDKTINELCISGKEAFISTNSGLAVIDISDGFFENLYDFGVKVTKCRADSRYIYATTPNGTYKGNRSLNLLTLQNWTLLSSAQLASDAVYASLKNENVNDSEALSAAKDFTVDSPLRNYSYKLNMQGNRLLVAGGNFYYPMQAYTGTIMTYQNGKWGAFDEDIPLSNPGALFYRNITDIVQDPTDPEHHWAGTVRSGIYEYREGKMVRNYTYTNSPLTSILPNDKNAGYYVRVTALSYDNDNNLWMCNNECDTIVRILTPEGKWHSYYYANIAGYPTFDNITFDANGRTWIQQRRTTASGHKAGLLIIDTNGTIATQSDDKTRFITTIRNQDGTSYTPDLYFCATPTLDGSIWIGTSEGLFIVDDPSTVFDTDFHVTQIKVPRNDGTDLADYLLNGVSIQCITVDGGNRKWVGTTGNGVYLISADGLTTLHHFTKDDSPLISNVINDIVIDGTTGEVFIATDKGLCSYKGDATDPSESMSTSTLHVYPNPVRPEYSGNVHITGLMNNSDVKIVNAAGKLVYQGTSVGGQFNWNCQYKTGTRASSGIYYALCTDENGKKSATAKILIVR